MCLTRRPLTIKTIEGYRDISVSFVFSILNEVLGRILPIFRPLSQYFGKHA